MVAFLGRVAATMALCLVSAACTSGGPAPAPSAPDPSTTASTATLTNQRPCPEEGFTCGDLVVPLDRSGRVPGTLTLSMAVGNGDAPRGTLLFLTGGPGQPGVPFLPRIKQRAAQLLDNAYRMVVIDQRGTGPAGIDCPKLQNEVGSSDVTAPSVGAVQECADLIGPDREFYTTADTVADLEDLRAALDVPQWTVLGISYGTFVGARYALAHPSKVSRMVLDSVVPQDGVPILYTEGMARAAFVLREACKEQSCGYDPASDLAAVVRRHGNGVGVYDLIVLASIVDPKLTGQNFYPVLKLLHQAAQGDVGPLNEAISTMVDGTDPYQEFSSGLHAATLCADLIELPWASPSAPLAGRQEAVDRAVAALPESAVWPFNQQTAAEQGMVATCVPWPPTRPNPPVGDARLSMPVLVLAGDRDLSTPVEWAQEQAALTPKAELVVVAGMGHSITGRNPEGDAAIRRFLLG